MPEKVNLDNIELFNDKLINLKQDFFDVIHPIGETYTQYPQHDDPNTLYNRNGVTCQWEKINYGGAFFRAEGGNANPYITKTDVLSIQGQSTAKNGLSLSKSGSAYKTGSCYKSGSCYANQQTIDGGGHEHSYNTFGSTASLYTGMATMQYGIGSETFSTTGGGGHSHTFTPSITDNIGVVDNIGVADNISFSLSGDAETRPSNYTYIIWERVS